MTLATAPSGVVIGPDRLGRSLRDLRISVTDKCNFRCPYCMPKSRFGPGHRFLPRAEALEAQEIVRLAAVFQSLGVTKIRLTGGEPLLRPDLVDIVAGISAIGMRDIFTDIPTSAGLTARYVTDWAGPRARPADARPDRCRRRGSGYTARHFHQQLA